VEYCNVAENSWPITPSLHYSNFQLFIDKVQVIPYKNSAAASLSGRNSAVECQLPKLDVTGSIPVARSKNFSIHDRSDGPGQFAPGYSGYCSGVIHLIKALYEYHYHQNRTDNGKPYPGAI
jgi:hypothetical protein